MKKQLQIAVGILKKQNDVLIALRQVGQDHADHWEFPGGKVEAGETVLEALVREFQEEIGVATTGWQPLIEIPWEYPKVQVHLNVFITESYSGQPSGQEGQEVKWTSIDSLSDYTFPEANQGIMTALQLPSQYMISGAMHNLKDGLGRLEATLEEGTRLVELKPKGLELSDFFQFIEAAIERCHSYGAKVLLNGKPEWLLKFPQADGLQLSSSALLSFTERPIGRDKLLGVSAHSDVDIAKALELKADFLSLSPVKPTSAHPDLEALQWQGFARKVKDIPIPVYALGGMKPNEEVESIQQGGQGVALTKGLWPEPI